MAIPIRSIAPDPEAAVAPIKRPFIYNCWYVAAWATEITDNILGRKMLNVPVAMFRQENGEVAAVLDACPHKFAPLSMGKRVGDVIQCAYHGLQFNGAGECVRNPHGSKRIPPNSTIPTFPIIECHGAIWIWLGKADLADKSLIPDFSFFLDPNRKAIYGKTHVEGNYQLSIDNLLDLGHAMYLHSQTAGDFGEAECIHDVGQDGNRVWDRRLYPSLPLPAGMAAKNKIPAGTLRDVSMDIEWVPGGLIQNEITVAPVGEARVGGQGHKSIHCLTPETEHTTHYFYANVRNHSLDDPTVDANQRKWQEQALKGEDSAMAAAIEKNMAAIKPFSIRQVYLETDKALGRVRRVIEQLIAKEAALTEGL